MASANQLFFSVPTFAIVTGASRGIGRAIAIEFARRFEDKLHLVLTARTDEGLHETAFLIHSLDSYSPERIAVKLVPGDLGKENEFPSLLNKLFDGIDATNYQHAVLVNNAASPGDVTKFIKDLSLADTSSIQEYWFLNVTATLLLSSKLLSTFSTPLLPGDGTKGRTRQTVVQISSRSSHNARASWGLYCTGKAARDMLHRVIAVEEPDVRVLSYTPGVVDTAMSRYAVANTTAPMTADHITGYYKVAVTPGRTAGVLCDLLHGDEYESGAILNFYDAIGHPESNEEKV